ncbi:PAS domain S-box protein [Dendrosporobacter sp. 1207_IL3150]|uniref:PAS domain S-box protein n=1 Tax=Dendrosporobacter sp. 1207_IL3150 TaxID=3084054 RepID=UPI002FDACE97
MTKQKVNILMVDDHPENILALEAVLASEEYNLISADSGEQALRYVLQEDFAVILLDVQMPGLNGFETAKLIKAREKSRHIPIVFITAINHPPDYISEGYSVGAIDYIVKPFQPNSLRSKVDQFVKLHRKYKEAKQDSQLLDTKTIELEQTSARLDSIKLDLRKTRALAKLIADIALDTIITFNSAGYILTVNPAIEKMFGYKAADLAGDRVEKLFLQSNQPRSSEVLIAGQSISLLADKISEVIAVRKSGVTFPADIQIRQANFENDCIYVCSIRDISERKLQYENLERLVEARTLELLSANTKLQHEIEERKIVADNLRLSQERFRKIFESSPSLMAIASCKDGRYIDVNESWVAFTGYSRQEVLDQVENKLNITFVSGQPDLVDISCNNSLRNARIRYYTKAGQVREALLSLESFEISGEQCQLLVVTDITERVFLENKMARFDRMNLIGEMAAGIAHEIRNPMTTVRGFLQMTKQRGKLSPSHIDLMIEELDRANAIITEYLSLAKDKPTDRRLQSLNQVVENILPLIQAEAIRSDKFVIFDSKPCPMLYLDEKEIRQLVLNLALNGLEAMSTGGILEIKTYIENKTVILAVQDQGIGMKPELLDKVGTPFFTTKEQGTGLGVAVCYSVAARHDANIEYESCEFGTTVFVRFRLSTDADN